MREASPQHLQCGWCGYLLEVHYLLWDEYEGLVTLTMTKEWAKDVPRVHGRK